MTTVGIVTGAGRGMGRACADLVSELVDVVILVDLDEEAAVLAATELGPSAEPFVLDVTDRDGLGRLAARVAELGTLRAVAHAAGISPTMADWRRVLEVDLVGTALLLEALHPLVTTGTAVVCFASMAPYTGSQDPDPTVDAVLDAPLAGDFLDRIHVALGAAIENSGIAYTYAKRGVHRLIEREAVRYGPAGGRVTSLSPGLIETPMGELEFKNHPIKMTLLAKTPLGRLGTPNEIARAVRFLLSDDASWINGIDLLVDGGIRAALRTESDPPA